ncbi:MAG: hypothetical protein IT520_15645 [Burkholderiales bacterium]|nr:hypothetical protein [Burkholderiales bacterium]
MLSGAWRARLGFARRLFGFAGTVLLGGALVVAPILAIGGDMRVVSIAGIAGIACLIVMRILPRADVPAETPADPDADAPTRD